MNAKKLITLLAAALPVAVLGQANFATPYTFTTLAGYDHYGSWDGTGSVARFLHPVGVTVDSASNVYVTDSRANTLRKVTPAGVVTTLAGSAGNAGYADETGTNALFNGPYGVAVDSAGNLYVADAGNNAIRKVTPAGVVTTLAGSGNYGYADGTGTDALFADPTGVAVDRAGNVFVTDYAANTIRKVTPAGVVTTLAGSAGNAGYADGTGTNALFSDPEAVAVDSAGNLYVADFGTCIRKVTPAGVVTTLAGLGANGGWNSLADGTGSAAAFNSPWGVAVDSTLNVYVSDTVNNSIRKGFPASSVPAPILQPPSLSAGQFGFGIAGLPNLSVDIESSGDLSQWQVIGTYVLQGGTNYIVGPTSPQGLQFYRGHVR